MKKIHFVIAIVLGGFVAVHIVNHLMALAGIDVHIAFMEGFRPIYRQPVIEAVLIVAVVAQIVLGARLLVGALKYPASFYGRLQLLSGVYLAFFLTIHVSAILWGRFVQGLDTNFYYAVAGYQFPLTRLFFAPYYFFAVVAFFVHIGCAFYWKMHEADQGRGRLWAKGFIIAGVLVSALITSALAGLTTSYQVPEKYLKTYRALAG